MGAQVDRCIRVGEPKCPRGAGRMLDSNNRGQSIKRPMPSALSSLLRMSEGILELLPIAAFICDAKGTILQYNRHAVAVWGRLPEPGQTHDQFRESARFFEMDGTPV